MTVVDSERSMNSSSPKDDYTYASLMAAASNNNKNKNNSQQQQLSGRAVGSSSLQRNPITMSTRTTRNTDTSDHSQRSTASSNAPFHSSSRAHQLGALTTSLAAARGERTPLLLFRDHAGPHSSPPDHHTAWSWFPGMWEDEDEDLNNPQWTPYYHGLKNKPHRFTRRSFRRRLFLFVTEPRTSIGSAAFFVVLIVSIALSNLIMIMQTMTRWQFVPDDCESCGGSVYYMFEDDAFQAQEGEPCVCPPAPLPLIVSIEDWIVYFFTVEWSLRVLAYEPSPSQRSNTFGGSFCQWLSFLTDYTTVMDALAIFPYYAERIDKSKGLMSLRLLRLLRVFQLVRLGAYNTTFLCLTNVLAKSLLYLRLLVVCLVFGSAFFGSIMYFLEKGEWKFHTESGTYQFLRLAADGVTEELSPFTSIPAAFWWFLVTATTVGYGDTVPTTTPGKWVAAMAMLMGVLVIAFPVSVFSDLWSRELRRAGIHFEEDEEEDTELEFSETLEQEGEERDVMGKNGAEEDFRSGSNHDMMEFSDEIDSRTIEMTRNDVTRLAKHMRTIDRSQQRIRDILAKYEIDT